MRLRKYTLVYQDDSRIVKFLHIESTPPRHDPVKGYLWDSIVASHGLVTSQLWFVFDGHCQPSFGWE